MHKEKINTLKKYESCRINGNLCICAEVKRLNDGVESKIFINTSIEPIDCTNPIKNHNHDIKCRAYLIICNFLFTKNFEKNSINYYNFNNELKFIKVNKKPTCAY